MAIALTALAVSAALLVGRIRWQRKTADHLAYGGAVTSIEGLTVFGLPPR